VSVIFLYNEIYRNSSYGKNHPVTLNRVSNVYDASKLMNFNNKIQYMYNDLATHKQLGIFHNEEYINKLRITEKNQSISKEDMQKYNIGTLDNPIFPEMYRRHAAATGALLLAAKLVNTGEKYIFSPGSGAHHGKPSMASGFCYFNDIATCILQLKKIGFRKILYFDMDAHYGDGVIESFRNDPEVVTVSLHQKTLWPKQNSYEFDKKLNILNIPVQEGFNDNELKEIFDNKIFPYLEKEKIEVALMQMGADCLKDDPISKLELSNNAMMYVLSKVKQIIEKIVVMGGGGYNPWITLRAWLYNLAVLNNENLPIILNNETKHFLKSIQWKINPKKIWLNQLHDEINIFI
tara:strand:+ start:805 stop:1851 length:1047 start_codon:yes stop_codon:yes gene_type:complete